MVLAVSAAGPARAIAPGLGAPIPATPPHVSVNRVRVVDLPGLAMDEEVRGRRADDLLSSRAVVRYAGEHAGALGLSAADAPDMLHASREWPRLVDRCLDSSDPAARTAAQTIARRLGRNLGHVLLTLHRGDAVNRQARADWADEDWARWATVRHVWLGGGIVSGRLGVLIEQEAGAFLAEAGYAGRPHVTLSAWPGMVALLGAARYLPPVRHAVCLDCGHTFIKRACVTLDDGALIGLTGYAAVPVTVDWLGGPGEPNVTTGRWVLDRLVEAIAQTWDEGTAGELPPDEHVMVSVAAYVRNGRLLGNGLYANLNTLADDVPALLSAAASDRLGRPVQVHLIHDGTAAGAVYAGQPDTAIIVAGTALGVGFPPASAEGLRPLDCRLEADSRPRPHC
ncbi:MAG: hypothetical protein KKA73_30575 [Chloroflexi bacterium]|nr:hypothetical protein [Chloroflexota bacterium]MBU1752046.1 hypothetical protein [Chloroflexota bacterium]